jgi:hypothetical protein
VRALACIAITCFASSPAIADGAKAKVARGEDLAKQGRLTEAIESFKAADKLEKRAKHACLIALAYIRRELWPQAEIFLTTCHERANASDPVPDWVPLAEQQLKERLAKAKVAAVKIRIAPETLAGQALIAVSSFEPDELFAPRVVHLTRGKHLITATVEGRQPAQQTVEVTDTTPRDMEVVIDFERKDQIAPKPVGAPPPPRAKEAPGPSKIPLAVMGAGGAIMLGGFAFHLLAYKPARDELANATTPAEYDAIDRMGTYNSRRTTLFALYGVGALTIATGVILKRTVYKDRPERAPLATVAPTNGGAVLTVGWSR